MIEIQGDIIGTDVGEDRLDSPVVRRLNPRRDVGIVIESGHNDLRAGFPPASDRSRHGEGERGHVWPEDDLVRICTQQIGCCLPGRSHSALRILAGSEPASHIGD